MGATRRVALSVFGDPCRCGQCCERLILEADVEDAENEPLIAIYGTPLRDGDGRISVYLLNKHDNGRTACVFLSRDSDGLGVCTIYGTRPRMCREFDCETEEATTDVQDECQ